MAEQVAKPRKYYEGCNVQLAAAVPSGARDILDVGCADGKFGAFLKDAAPQRRVFGLERNPDAARRAEARLDKDFCIDVEEEDPELEPGSLECITYGDVLEHLRDPGKVLERHRRFLRRDGLIVCSIPNIQHHSIFKALARGDFQYTEMGLLDSTHLRFYTWSTFTKLLLDAGYAPAIEDANRSRPRPEVLAALAPYLRRVGVHPNAVRRQLGVFQYIFSGRPLKDAGTEATTAGAQEEPAAEPLTFVAAVNDEDRFAANLLRSPCLAPGSPHEVIPMRGYGNAADALNEGIRRASHGTVVCVHQDVYLPKGWDVRFTRQLVSVRRSGPVGVVGVWGVVPEGEERVGIGRVVDRQYLLQGKAELPAPVDTVDELLLAVPRDTPLRFDPRLGFHFYGADLCLQARKRGLSVHAIDALCFHNSLFHEFPDDFYPSGHAFAVKWASDLPVVTSCARVDADWKASRPRNWRWLARVRHAWRHVERQVDKAQARLRQKT
ncbi:MAG: methyltransferase domain-containing protein [Deltaproteobacteria bacterium]|nr:methyltransferase domain-containing protein [Deltaproteobacteria bacterium]